MSWAGLAVPNSHGDHAPNFATYSIFASLYNILNVLFGLKVGRRQSPLPPPPNPTPKPPKGHKQPGLLGACFLLKGALFMAWGRWGGGGGGMQLRRMLLAEDLRLGELADQLKS